MGQKPVGLETPLPPEERPAAHASEAAPAESRVASPATEAQAPAGSPPNLPDFAKKADDLEAIKKAVDDAASVSGALWFSYLFVLFYLAVAAGAVTHVDLFLENPVKLPFLGVELPLFAFFFLAPILFLIVHAYVLVHLVMLTDKAKRFHEALHRQFGEGTGLSNEKAKDIRDGLRRQLPSNVFVQFLAGAPETRRGLFGFALRAIGWATLVVGPVLLLLLCQLQFLPYHNSFVTWTQRLAVFVDLILIWWLWGRVLSGRDSEDTRNWRTALMTFSAFGLSVGIFLFSVLTVYFPGELQEGRPTRLARPESGLSLNELIFHSPVDDATRHRQLPFSNTLVLTGFNIYEGLKIDDPKKAEWRDFVFRARGRDLKGAIFDLASLPKVDFEGAELERASLEETRLQGTSLKSAEFQGAKLGFAQLQGANLEGSELQDAWFNGADLKGASLDGARFQGGNLKEAQLTGASLIAADLQDADLFGAALQSATLDRANLQGADMVAAELQGASLSEANLEGAELKNSNLDGASLRSAGLQGARLDDAHLNGTSLDNAALLGASLGNAQLEGASLVGAQLQGATLQQARLRATDFSSANLWRTDLVPPPSIESVRVADAAHMWLPEWRDSQSTFRPWNQEILSGLAKENAIFRSKR